MNNGGGGCGQKDEVMIDCQVTMMVMMTRTRAQAHERQWWSPSVDAVEQSALLTSCLAAVEAGIHRQPEEGKASRVHRRRSRCSGPGCRS